MAYPTETTDVHSAIIEATNDMIVVTDRDGVITYVNPALTQCTGYTAEEVIGRKTSLFKSGEHDRAFYEELWRTVLSGEVWRGEIINRRKDASLYPEEQLITPVSDQDGKITRFVALKRDISERRDAEDTIQSLESRYREVGSNIPGVVFQALLKLDGTITVPFVSEGSAAFGGWTVAEITSQDMDVWALVFPDDHGLLRDLMADGIQALKPLTGELRIRTRDGEIKWIQLNATPRWSAPDEIVWDGVVLDITHRKRVEEELLSAHATLQESEERHRKLFTATRDAVFIADAVTGQIVDANDAAIALLCRPREQLIGMHQTELHPPEKDDEYRKMFREHVEAEGSNPVEAEVQLPNGERVPVDICASVFTHNGKQFVQGHFRDITERKKGEQRIILQSALLQAINTVFREALVCETEEEVARTCLAVAEQLTTSEFGFIGELNEAGLFNIIAISDPGWAVCKMPNSEAVRLIKNMTIHGIDRSTLRHGISRIVNEPHLHPDSTGVPEGHPPVKSFLGVPLAHGGKTIGMIGLANKESVYNSADQEAVENLAIAFVEALMRKRAEEALRESKEKFRGILDNAGIGIALIGPNLEILELNRQMRKWFPHVDPACRPTCFRAYNQPPRDEPCPWCPTIRTLQDGSVHESAMETPTAAGVQNCRVVSSPVRNAQGEIVGAIELVEDLTERRRAEEAERERRNLEQAIKAMEQVLGVVGHELRTPLAALRVLSELLTTEGAVTVDQQAEYMKSVHDETIRMADLVNNLLEAARLNSGCARWNWDEAELAAVCNEAVRTVDPLIDRDQVEIRHEVTPPGLMMKGDPEAIRRLLVNLATNAAKHTSQGSIDIKVGELSDLEGRWIELIVQDTGEGIAEEVKKKLGQAFVLNSGALGSDYVRGSGLGLAICKAIVAAHGGTISVDSTVGEGTTFTAHLKADLESPVDIDTNIKIDRGLVA